MVAKELKSGRAAALAVAARTAFTAIREGAPEEDFYFFALYTTEDGSYVCATAWSEAALASAVRASRKRDKRTGIAELTQRLRFSAPDSPYHDTYGEGFAALPPGKKLHDVCFDALRILDEDGFFGRGARRSKIIVNVVYGDMSNERWMAHAARLNPLAALKAAASFMPLQVVGGRVAQWGAAAYQANALSLSADRSRVAYSGSGGEVGVLQIADRKAVYEKKRKGEHWACALSADGSRLYLGDSDGIGVLSVGSGTMSPLAKCGKPGELALSPDGSRIAATSFDAPLRIFDTASGRRLWESKAMENGALAFSPCSTWLAVGAARAERGKWTGTLTCFEAASGRRRWSSPLGAAYNVRLAWSPEGNDILVGVSTWLGAGMDPDQAASVAFFSADEGKKQRVIPWTRAVDAVALSERGQRIAICSTDVVVALDRVGTELARGKGTQEHLAACAFADDSTVLAVGRDVNRGPAIVALAIP